MKVHIFKLWDRDDRNSDDQYYTIKSLREQILNEWYDIWESMPTAEVKAKLETDDDYMFDWLSDWGFNTQVIYTITEKDLN